MLAAQGSLGGTSSIFQSTVICFNEAGVRLYHMLGCTGLLHCDTMGTIVTGSPIKKYKEATNNQLLYYAVVLAHPKKDRLPIAIAEMISATHTVVASSHFLSAESQLYSHASRIQPWYVVIDRSLVLLFLYVFNSETLDAFFEKIISNC